MTTTTGESAVVKPVWSAHEGAKRVRMVTSDPKLVMTPEAARELANALLDAADQADR